MQSLRAHNGFSRVFGMSYSATCERGPYWLSGLNIRAMDGRARAARRRLFHFDTLRLLRAGIRRKNLRKIIGDDGDQSVFSRWALSWSGKRVQPSMPAGLPVGKQRKTVRNSAGRLGK